MAVAPLWNICVRVFCNRLGIFEHVSISGRQCQLFFFSVCRARGYSSANISEICNSTNGNNYGNSTGME